MKNASKRAAILVIVLFLPGWSEAISPLIPLPDGTAKIIRNVTSFIDFQEDTICVKRPEPRPDYMPGRLRVSLFVEGGGFGADLETRPYIKGYECVRVFLSNKSVDEYKIQIIDETEKTRDHESYVGRLVDLKVSSAEYPWHLTTADFVRNPGKSK